MCNAQQSRKDVFVVINRRTESMRDLDCHARYQRYSIMMRHFSLFVSIFIELRARKKHIDALKSCLSKENSYVESMMSRSINLSLFYEIKISKFFISKD